MGALQSLLFSFDGRIGRGRFWLGLLAIFIATLAASTIAIWLGFAQTEAQEGYSVVNGVRTEFSGFRTVLSPIASFGISLLLVGPWLAIAIKRRHDRGNNGYDIIVFTTLNLALQLLAVLGLGGQVLAMLGLVAFIWGVVMLILLGFLKGTTGANSYGPDPLDAAA